MTTQATPTPERTIIVGDVHGCPREVDDLLREVDYDSNRDRVYFIGDLINKGPDSRAVFSLYSDLGARSVLGNHEYALFTSSKNSLFERMQKEFGSAFDDFLASVRQWPRILRMPGVILVHGGFVPGILPEAQPLSDLIGLRHLPEGDEQTPWFSEYSGSELVVFGHWAALQGVETPKVIGLDTGCVYGGRLSALLLPERTIVSVPARKTYQTF